MVAGDIGPTGSIMKPWGDLEYATAVEVFAEQAAALVDGGADVLWIETMCLIWKRFGRQLKAPSRRRRVFLWSPRCPLIRRATP